jgi:hypothetical protein
VAGGSTAIAFVQDPDGYKFELIQRGALQGRPPGANPRPVGVDNNHAARASIAAAGHLR